MVENLHATKIEIDAAGALYREIGRGIAWKRNRKTEFQGTLRHFLLSVFYDRLEEQGFIIKRSWKDAKDFQKTQEISPSVAFVQFHQMNKVFYWDPFLKKSMYLHYSLQEDYPLLSKVNDLMQVPPSKSLLMNDRLLVFHAWKSDFVKGDVRIAYFAIKKDDSGETPMLLIDDQGNYRIKSGELIWNYLDNQTNLLSALPEDYKWNNEK